MRLRVASPPALLVVLALTTGPLTAAGAAGSTTAAPSVSTAAAPVARGAAAGAPASEAAVRERLRPEADIQALRSLGPGVMPALASIYERSDSAGRAYLAWVMSQMGFESPEAKRALIGDMRASDEQLRLQVQWAIGRVSHDDDVVDLLLETMQHDDSPLFRDKAACALASDQIFLTERQKVALFARLIAALRDRDQAVRRSALRVLEIHTGQTKDFNPKAPLGQREMAVKAWERWLEEYRSNL
jgi:HEAT repeat protein